MTVNRPYLEHLKSSDDLVTTYEATRAGFVSMAIEKNRQATPFVQQARALKVVASKAKSPLDLLTIQDIESSLLLAAGISDKATEHLQDSDRKDAIMALINNYLAPQGESWVEELVYRFLLTRGDTLGGMMRNIAGMLAQRKVTRAIISALVIIGETYQWLDLSTNKWLPKPEDDSDIELRVKGLSWQKEDSSRSLLYNIKVPSVNKNVDLCLFNRGYKDLATDRLTKAVYKTSELYVALGELKGGIDPAGADEHWKTAQSALSRIQKSFSDVSPYLFFIGAAIEKDMANEIWHQLENGMLANAANLTNEDQMASICLWLCRL